MYTFNVSLKEIRCSEPADVLNAFVRNSSMESSLGAVVTYQCNSNFSLYADGFQLNYTNVFNKTCQIDTDQITGTWSVGYLCDSKISSRYINRESNYFI